MLFTRPRTSPCRKVRSGRNLEMKNAQTIKMASQTRGSTREGMMETVPRAIANPSIDKAKISFQLKTYIPPMIQLLIEYLECATECVPGLVIRGEPDRAAVVEVQHDCKSVTRRSQVGDRPGSVIDFDSGV